MHNFMSKFTHLEKKDEEKENDRKKARIRKIKTKRK